MADDPSKLTPEDARALAEAMREANERIDETLRSQKEIVEQLKLKIEFEDNIALKLEFQKQLLIEQAKLNEKQIQFYEEKIKKAEELNNLELAQLKALQATEKASKAIPSLFDVLLGGEKGGDKLISDISNIGNALEKNLRKSLEDSISSFDISSAIENMFALPTVAEAATAATGPAGFYKVIFDRIKDNFLEPLMEMFSAASIFLLSKYINQTITLASSLADLEIEFMRTTGANREFARSVTVGYSETRRFGVGAKEAMAAAQDLFGTFTDFTFQNIKTREELVIATALLDALGFNAKDAATSLQIMTKAMGRGPGGASQEMLNLTKFAEELGVPVSKIGSDFAASAGSLAKLGDTGVDAFKRLAIASKVTGLEFS